MACRLISLTSNRYVLFLGMATNEKKTRNVNGIDSTGHQVAANIARLRGGMTYKELSEQLGIVGRPMPVLALRRIESCERKVDVDDLVAFAIVFGVSPLTLLLPEYASHTVTTRITGFNAPVPSALAWSWAKCDLPLPTGELEAMRKAGDVAGYLEAGALFKFRSNPKKIEDDPVTQPGSGR